MTDTLETPASDPTPDAPRSRGLAMLRAAGPVLGQAVRALARYEDYLVLLMHPSVDGHAAVAARATDCPRLDDGTLVLLYACDTGLEVLRSGGYGETADVFVSTQRPGRLHVAALYEDRSEPLWIAREPQDGLVESLRDHVFDPDREPSMRHPDGAALAPAEQVELGTGIEAIGRALVAALENGAPPGDLMFLRVEPDAPPYASLREKFAAAAPGHVVDAGAPLEAVVSHRAMLAVLTPAIEPAVAAALAAVPAGCVSVVRLGGAAFSFWHLRLVRPAAPQDP